MVCVPNMFEIVTNMDISDLVLCCFIKEFRIAGFIEKFLLIPHYFYYICDE